MNGRVFVNNQSINEVCGTELSFPNITVDEFLIMLTETKIESSKYGLRLKEIIINNNLFDVITNAYESRLNSKIDKEYLRHNSFQVEGIKATVCDYDREGNFIKYYQPIYE